MSGRRRGLACGCAGSRVLLRRSAGALVAVAALATLWQSSASAQTATSVALLSNLSQVSTTAFSVSPNNSDLDFTKVSQQFTTGSQSQVVTSVDLHVSVFDGASAVVVGLYTDDSGSPGTLLYMFADPGGDHGGLVRFTAPANATLAAASTYHIVVTSEGGSVTVAAASSMDLATGGRWSDGWSIGAGQVFDRYTAGWVGGFRNVLLSINTSVSVESAWTATLTVAKVTDVHDLSIDTARGCSFGNSNFYCDSHLADDEFTYRSRLYTVLELALYPDGTLTLELDGLVNIDNSLTLLVDGLRFALDDATGDVNDDGASWDTNYDWRDWEVGDTVDVRLVDFRVADASLRRLTVDPVDLHGFDPQVTEYAVGVASTVEQVTFGATTNHSGASVEYGVDDADGMATGHQVDLSAGVNTVTVTVTAGNNVNVTGYSVTVGRGVTDVYGWRASDDFDGLRAAGNTEPYGLWSDGSLVWVADSGAGKLFAYALSGGSRSSSRDILLDVANDGAAGVWSDGVTVWVVDSGAGKLFAYALSDGSRRSGGDISLDVANDGAAGVWSDGVTVWVVDSGAGKLFAYALSDGSRRSGGDISLDVANDGAAGVWSDGVTVWVADSGAGKLFAYDLESRARAESLEFNTLSDAGNSPLGLWSDGVTMWVADSVLSKAYSYVMPVSDDAQLATLALDGAQVHGFDPDTATYTVQVAPRVREVTVAARPRQLRAVVTGISPPDARLGMDGHQVDIDAADTVIETTVTAQDGITTEVYSLTVRNPALSQPPEFTSAPDGSVDEGTRPGQQIVTVAAVDPEGRVPLDFKLDRAGAEVFDIVAVGATSAEVRTKAALDHETAASYSVTVTATDTDGVSASDTLVVAVANVDEPGSLSLFPTQPQVGTALTATLTDPDGSVSEVEWEWERERVGGWDEIDGIGSGVYTPVGTDTGQRLRVRVTYSDAQGTDKTALLTSTNAVLESPFGNRPPQFPDSTTVRAVAENLPRGSRVGSPVMATDLDSDILTYTVSGDLAFEIDASTGQITTTTDLSIAGLDHEARDSHSVTVTAADPSRQQGSITVTIEIEDADDAGAISLPELQPRVADAFTATLSDPDGGLADIVWEWERSLDQSDWAALDGAVSSGRTSSYTPSADDEGYWLRVAVSSYSDALGSGRSVPAQQAQRVAPQESSSTEVSSSPVAGILRLPEPASEPELESAGFLDVGSSSAHARAVDAVYAAGMTRGCSTEPLLYCPGTVVTRAQMASFLARALELVAPARPGGFGDVSLHSVHAWAVDAVYAAGITRGCSTEPLLYCPDEAVTRAQMASFLARALELAESAGFADVAFDDSHARAIDALYAAGITEGCSTEPLLYCPDEAVTRAQMASFLARAFKLV